MPAPQNSPVSNRAHYDRAIGAQMSRVKRSHPARKDRMRLILVHLNVARDLETLGHHSYAVTLLRIANEMAKNGQTLTPPTPVTPPAALNRAIGLCMHAARRASPDEKVVAKQALSHFNLARTTAKLGYGSLSGFLTKYGENLLAQIDPTLSPDEQAQGRADNAAAIKAPVPVHPVAPTDPSPFVRMIDGAIATIKGKLDAVGITF